MTILDDKGINGPLQQLEDMISLPPKKSSTSKKDTRARSWTAVFYPESAPKNWRVVLDDLHVEWVCSPLHDKDLNPTRELKKPHYHLLLMFGHVKSYEQVVELLAPLRCPAPQRIHNNYSMVRYMVHADNPEKAQYKVSDIICGCGADLQEILRPRPSERYNLVREMMMWVKENECTEFCQLMDYAMTERFEDWFPVLCDSSCFVIGQYIKSQRQDLMMQRRKSDMEAFKKG